MADHNNESQDIQQLLGMDDARGKWRKRAWLAATLALALAAGAWFIWRPAGDAAQIQYQTAPLTRGSLEVVVSATGSLEPVNQVDVGSEVSGTIRELKADFNDNVRKGQVLAVLDTTKLEAQRNQAQAALEVSQAELQNALAAAREAEVDLKRLQRAYDLSKGRLPSRQDLDAAQAAHDKAQAQVAVARATIAKNKASLDAYASDLAKAVIVAPMDGLVLSREVEEGQTVAASLEAPVLFTLAENLTSMELIVSVDEADVGQVKEGQRAGFVVDAYPDKRFPAKITQVRFAPQEEDGVVTYECILAVDNSALLLRPGMTATADIVTIELADALLAPNMALRYQPQQAEAAANESSDGNILSKIMPGPRRRHKANKQPGSVRSDSGQAQARLWVLAQGQPRPVAVTTGPSDGVRTQIAAGPVEEGQAVIIGQAAAR